MSYQSLIKNKIASSITVKEAILKDEELLNKIEQYAQLLIDSFKKDGKTFFCGNGGSAADAQHLSAELSGRYYLNRKPLYSEALHVNSSYVTAVANDYGYHEVYARMVEACCRNNDVLVCISTSGNSENILKAISAAKKQGSTVIGMTGSTGGKMAELVDLLINVPSNDTPRIQESHILIGHLVCEIVEKELFAQND